MSAPAAPFTPQAYADLVASFRAMGYQARDYADADPGEKHLIVRHDVDFSLDAALAMAEAERDMELDATYFVLVRTEFYNLHSKAGRSALERLLACGHRIGLHFDAALYPDDGAAQEQGAAEECAALEAIVRRPVQTVSFHRPAARLIGQAERIAGRLNAYGPRYVRDMGYCSDSRGAWHHGAPLDHPAVREGRALHLLVHPIWWQQPPLPPAERIRQFVDGRADELDREVARHSNVHRPRERSG